MGVGHPVNHQPFGRHHPQVISHDVPRAHRDAIAHHPRVPRRARLAQHHRRCAQATVDHRDAIAVPVQVFQGSAGKGIPQRSLPAESLGRSGEFDFGFWFGPGDIGARTLSRDRGVGGHLGHHRDRIGNGGQLGLSSSRKERQKQSRNHSGPTAPHERRPVQAPQPGQQQGHQNRKNHGVAAHMDQGQRHAGQQVTQGGGFAQSIGQDTGHVGQQIINEGTSQADENGPHRGHGFLPLEVAGPDTVPTLCPQNARRTEAHRLGRQQQGHRQTIGRPQRIDDGRQRAGSKTRASAQNTTTDGNNQGHQLDIGHPGQQIAGPDGRAGKQAQQHRLPDRG